MSRNGFEASLDDAGGVAPTTGNGETPAAPAEAVGDGKLEGLIGAGATGLMAADGGTIAVEVAEGVVIGGETGVPAGKTGSDGRAGLANGEAVLARPEGAVSTGLGADEGAGTVAATILIAPASEAGVAPSTLSGGNVSGRSTRICCPLGM